MYRSPYDIYFQSQKKIEGLVLAHSQSGTRRRRVASTTFQSLTPQKELVSWPRGQLVEHGKSIRNQSCCNISTGACKLVLTPRASQRQIAFANKVFWKIFRCTKEDVSGDCRKLHNKELNDLHSSTGIIRVIKTRKFKWAGHVAHMGERRNAYGVLVGKP